MWTISPLLYIHILIKGISEMSRKKSELAQKIGTFAALGEYGGGHLGGIR
jgi:hypothetical protein